MVCNENKREDREGDALVVTGISSPSNPIISHKTVSWWIGRNAITSAHAVSFRGR